MNISFRNWMKETQADVEVALNQYLPSTQTVPENLHEAMAYAVLDGGKRVRPLLVFAAGKLFDAPQELLSRAACAVEMIHAYSLVHDDMPCMDDDALRRGKPTVHKQYNEATALLVGDALQAQAFIVLSNAKASADRILPMLQLLAQASGSIGMCGGQAIDLASVGQALTLSELEQMHRLKTGALLRASVLLGAMGGKLLSPDEIQALDSYSSAIGLAFQVVDDVLDATADSATLGKTAGKDAADNKPTYVSLLGLDASRQLAAQLCSDAHQALSQFGESAQHLHDLADLIVQRKA
ncbi:polyprenyl synthetase family protein [Undibacterium sp. Di24W]|uniref:polyprenyl synthetase family protein n=1 Tax=Undibacterium sp. Di24W TaxID=3413033 RepID=UPI003BF290A1